MNLSTQPAPVTPTIHTDRPSRTEWLALALVLILAAALRLGAPGIVEFKRDEANLSQLALNIVRGREFPLLGIDSSVGIRNAPINVYLLVIPYLLTSDPTIATQYIGLLNVIAVFLTYLLARRYYGPLAAFVAGLLYAVAPWAVIYSRKIWAQDMLPVFILVTVGTGLLGFLEGKRWAQWLHLPLLAITGQLHYVAFVLIPITLYLLFIGRRRLTRAFFLSIGLTALAVMPYVIGMLQASTLHPEALRRIVQPGGKPNPITISGQAFQYALLTVAGTEIHSLAGAQAFENYLASVPNVYPLFNGLGVAIALALGWLAVRSFLPNLPNSDRRPVDITLLIWALVAPLAFTITWVPVYTHYMIPIFPAAFLALGAAANDLVRAVARNRMLQSVVMGAGALVLIGLAILQIWLVVALLNFVNGTPTPGGFGVPLGQYMPIREAILSTKPKQVLADLDGQYVGYNDLTSIWSFLLADVPDVRFGNPGISVFSSDNLPYLSINCTDRTRNFVLAASNQCFSLGIRSAADFPEVDFTPIPPEAARLRFANGAHVASYRWKPEEGCLSVTWTVDGPASGPKSDDFNVAVHFFKADGEKILDADGFFWRGRFWRAGDTIVRRFCLSYGQERIAEIAGVRLGMYTYEDAPEAPGGRRFFGLDVLNANGVPIGQAIEISFSAR